MGSEIFKYIYLFRTHGTANTCTFEEKTEKKLIYMQHCTNAIPATVMIFLEPNFS